MKKILIAFIFLMSITTKCKGTDIIRPLDAKECNNFLMRKPSTFIKGWFDITILSDDKLQSVTRRGEERCPAVQKRGCTDPLLVQSSPAQ